MKKDDTIKLDMHKRSPKPWRQRGQGLCPPMEINDQHLGVGDN